MRNKTKTRKTKNRKTRNKIKGGSALNEPNLKKQKKNETDNRTFHYNTRGSIEFDSKLDKLFEDVRVFISSTTFQPSNAFNRSINVPLLKSNLNKLNPQHSTFDPKYSTISNHLFRLRGVVSLDLDLLTMTQEQSPRASDQYNAVEDIAKYLELSNELQAKNPGST